MVQVENDESLWYFEPNHYMTQERESQRFRMISLAAAGSREEIEEAIELLQGVGFSVLPIPIINEDGHFITSPEFRFKGRTYKGIEEIKELTSNISHPDPST